MPKMNKLPLKVIRIAVLILSFYSTYNKVWIDKQ